MIRGGSRFARPINLKLEKWFPLQGERAHSLNVIVVCMYVNRKEEEKGETEQQLQSYQFTQGYITLHRLQVHHLTLINNQYNVNTPFIYIHTYNMNCSIHNGFCQNDTLIRYMF